MKQKRLLLTTLLGLGLTLVVLTVFVISPARADGNTYYVNAATGNDTTGDGSAGNPWQTLTHAAATVPASSDPANPNVISVAADSYNDTLETFPIVFNNANIRVTGASSATTYIDPDESGIVDTIWVNAPGITIEGFNIRNSYDYVTDVQKNGPAAIAIKSGGGTLIRDNYFDNYTEYGHGVVISVSETLDGTPYTLQPITITQNIFDDDLEDEVKGGVKIDLDLNGNNTSTDVTIGAISVLSNTFAYDNINDYLFSMGVYIDDFDVYSLTTSAVTVGDIIINGNSFEGYEGIHCEQDYDDGDDDFNFTEDGNFENLTNSTVTFADFRVENNTFSVYEDGIFVDECFNLETITDTTVYAGDTVIAGNVFETYHDYGGSALYLEDWYYPYEWYGASVGQFGDLIVRDNEVTYATNESLYAFTVWPEYLYGTTVITIGDILIENNQVLYADEEGLETGPGGGYFYDDVRATMGTTTVQSNTITYAYYDGIYLYHEFAYDVYDNSTATAGEFIVRNNQVLETDESAIEMWVEYLGYGNNGSDDAALVTAAPITITNNVLTSTESTIYFGYYEMGYEMAGDSKAEIGPVAIISNTIVNEGLDVDYETNGIYVYYEDVAADMYNNTQLVMGPLTIEDNNISSADDDAIEIYYYEDDGGYVGYDMYDNAYAQLPDHIVRGNTLNAGATGDYGVYWNSYETPYENYNDSTIDYGQLIVDDNTFNNGYYGVYYYNYEPCYGCYDNHTTIFSNTIITDNRFYNQEDTAIYLDIEYAGYYEHYGNLIFGDTLVSGNVISNTDYGVYYYNYESCYDCYDDATLAIGTVTVDYNQLYNIGTDAIYVELDDVGFDIDPDNVAITVGNPLNSYAIDIAENTVDSCDQKGIYSYLRLSGPDNTVANPTRIISNTVSNCFAGIYLDYADSGAVVQNNRIYNSSNTGLYLDMSDEDVATISGNTITHTTLVDPFGFGIILYGGQVNLATTNPLNYGTSLYNDGAVITTTTAFAADYDIKQDDGRIIAENNTMTVGRNLILAGGDFYAPTGLVPTGYFTHTGGTYYQTNAVNGSSDVGFPKAGGLILNANNSDLGSTDVAITAGAQCSGATNSVEHCYVITPTNTTSRDAIATFYFNASELDTLQTCSVVKSYYWDGTWDNAFSSDNQQCSIDPHSVRSTGLDTFGAFALRGDTLTVTKKDTLLTDVGNTGLSAGDTLQYTIVLRNNSTDTQFDNIQITDTPDTNTTLVTGTVSSTAGSVTTGNGAGDTTVAVNVGTLTANTVVTVTFNVTLNDPLPNGTTGITNHAVVSGDGFTAIDSDDPDTSSGYDATVTSFVSKLYFPLIVSNYRSLPDLVITNLQVAGQVITVTLENQGDTTAVNDFWVDVYFNPTETPTLNHPWQAIAPAGAVWGVTANIAAGGSLTLTSGGAYYRADLSSSTFPDGATVYGLVDSVNHNTTYGNVEESNEANNLWPGSGSAGVQAAGGGGASTPGLPER